MERESNEKNMIDRKIMSQQFHLLSFLCVFCVRLMLLMLDFILNFPSGERKMWMEKFT